MANIHGLSYPKIIWWLIKKILLTGTMASWKNNNPRMMRTMAGCSSLVSQLIALFNRGQFHRLVMKHRAGCYAKGYNSLDYFVAMLFCQFAQAKSLLGLYHRAP
jgi:hypothetical protein